MLNALERALLSLEGLSLGDAFGERFFLPHDELAVAIAQRVLPAGPWRYTDDTEMALSVVAELEAHGEIREESLFRAFAARFQPMRGYGPSAQRLLAAAADGVTWKQASSDLHHGMGSFGSGAAMRVAPLGAYFADDPSRCVEEALKSARVTHAHPEGAAGAVAVAVAATFAWRSRESAFDVDAFFGTVRDALSDLPGHLVREGIDEAYATRDEVDVALAAQRLGNGSGITAPDTVPLCLWLVAKNPDDYEAALWDTVSALGDRDTTSAIVGGILACRVGAEGLPSAWRARREPLPAAP